jgi:putative FmdB family regulatory protein
MPLYEFVCQSCGAFVERMLNVEYRDEPQRHYPCGQIMVRRPSTASFSVKGFNAANNYSSSKD